MSIKRLPKSFQVYGANKEEAEYLIEMQKKLCPHISTDVKQDGYYGFNTNGMCYSAAKESDLEIVSYTEFKEHFSNVDNFQWLVGHTLPKYKEAVMKRTHAWEELDSESGTLTALQNGNFKITGIGVYKNQVHIKGERNDYDGTCPWWIPITELYRTGLIYQLELSSEKILKVTDLGPNEVIWCNTKEECEKLHELMHQKGLKWCSGETYKDIYTESECYYPYAGEHCTKNYYESRNYKIYQASQFINNMEKEIIGYKIKQEYSHLGEAAHKIAHGIYHKAGKKYHWADKDVNFCYNSEAHKTVEAAGVLELWFEPVYKKEEPKFAVGDWVVITDTGSTVSGFEVGGMGKYGAKSGTVTQIEGIEPRGGNATEKDPRYYGKNWNVREEGLRKATTEEIESAQQTVVSMNGQFNLVVKGKKVYHKNEDITQYVKSMVTSFREMNKKYQGYDAIMNLDTLEFVKTGCEQKKTKFSDWVKVYGMLKD